MWRLTRTAILFLTVMTLLTGVLYPAVVTGLAQALFPGQARGSLVKVKGDKIVSGLIGQPFKSPAYFWGRPSATSPRAYNAASSAGTNLGPSSPLLKETVQKSITALQAADPGNSLPVPVDLVTASGSGLDPHISPAAAMYQVSRIARTRGLDERQVVALVKRHIHSRQFGILGEPTVQVLLLNMELDSLR